MENNRVFQKIETFDTKDVIGLEDAKKEIFTDFDGSTVTFAVLGGVTYILETNILIKNEKI